MSVQDAVWDKLVAWLEGHEGFKSQLESRNVPGSGRGLFTTCESSFNPDEPLLRIPASALLNPLTLLQSASNPIPAHLFPRAAHRTSPSNKAKRVKPSHHPAAAINSNGHHRPLGDENDRGQAEAKAEEQGKRGRERERSTQLDTTQLLTLYLALCREPRRRRQSDWGAYIDSLPHTFRPWHPLTWLVPKSKFDSNSYSHSKSKGSPRSTGNGNGNGHSSQVASNDRIPQGEEEESGAIANDEADEWWANLARLGLSASARDKLDDVKRRFEDDRLLLQEVLDEEVAFRSFTGSLTTDDILWAWLNVNTRSVSLPLGLPGPSERNNHTLVPMLDCINHSSVPTTSISEVKQVSKTSRQPSTSASTSSAHRPSRKRDHLVPGRIDFIFSTSASASVSAPSSPPCPQATAGKSKAASAPASADREVFFQYGPHGSSTLFAEYGFVEAPPGKSDSEGRWLDLPHGQLDVDHLVSELWEGTGSPEERETKKAVLDALGCWRRNIIHTSPLPPHPSHALLMTLRLLHLSPSETARLGPIRLGLVTYISETNEGAVLQTMSEICKRTIGDSADRTTWLTSLVGVDVDVGIEQREQSGAEAKGQPERRERRERRDAVRTLLALCQEERALASAVLKRVEDGEDLS